MKTLPIIRKSVCIFASFILLCTVTSGQHAPRRLFQKALESVKPESIAAYGWCPYPDYHDRAAWDAYTGDRKADSSTASTANARERSA